MSSTHINSDKSSSRAEWPPIFDRFMQAMGDSSGTAHQPHKTVRRYHGKDLSVWYGRVHIDDIEGWVENTRLKYYLRQWRIRKNEPKAQPTSQDIYEIMIEADREERSEKKPFHIERIADNISINGIHEPVFIFVEPDGKPKLWDGNRRRFGAQHIITEEKYAQFRDSTQWIPAFIYSSSGDPQNDKDTKQRVITELNFKMKDHIEWPAFVRAEEIYNFFHSAQNQDPAATPIEIKKKIAKVYGLKGPQVAGRWIKMYDLAKEFQEFHEEERDRPSIEVELLIQEKFEYFDELSKNAVWGSLKIDPDARDEVFEWLWDGKFKSFPDVRKVPKILNDPVARVIANSDDDMAVKRAIEEVVRNDPVQVKDKSAAKQKINQFAQWLATFKPSDFKQLDVDSLTDLQSITTDISSMLAGLLSHQVSADGV